MSDGESSKSWWQTLPGILTGITAIITALAGLIVAVNQTNWFSHSKAEPETRPDETANAAPPPSVPQSTASETPPAAATAPAPPGAGNVILPDLRDYRFGEAVFTILSATLSSRNTESNTLTVRIRALNNGRYDMNFWDRSFRLIVDGVPSAPTSVLNDVVASNAAKEGEVTFIVPRSAGGVQLRILFHDEKTDIPLILKP